MKQENKNCLNGSTILDVNASNVFVAQNAKRRAFIEQFNYSSVNFTQKDLGSIFGFFVVRDDAETSENIVNFLASEIKKKYFSPVQKNAEEKFEITLHHINRALAEIANIGNVEWLGKIDGAICVIDDTTIYFSATGNAHILLLRENTLIDISKGLANEEASEQPLKTFVDISSGDLCPHDKIIVTSQELLDLVSFEELQKNAISFGQENFIQFIETVLTNECSIATTTIIDIYEKDNPQLQPEPTPAKETPQNAFSADAFEKELEQMPEITTDVDDLEMPTETPSEYTDPRTGHIHIQGDDEPIPEQTFMESAQEKLSDFFDNTKEIATRQWTTFSKTISNNKKTKALLKDATNIESVHKDKELDEVAEFDDIPDDSISSQIVTEITDATEEVPEEKSAVIAPNYLKIISSKFKQFKQVSHSVTRKILTRLLSYHTKTIAHSKKAYTKFQNKTKNPETAPEQEHSILPSVNHISKLWHKMDTRTKLTTASILIFIIIIPLLFAKFSHKKQNAPVNTDTTITQQSQTVSTEQADAPLDIPTRNNIKDPTILSSEPATISTILMNDKLTSITKDAIILLTSKEKEVFALPTDSGEIALGTPLDDLDLIFILTTTDKLYSFSPTTKKFIQQKNIPTFNHSETIGLGTYMTYLYTLTEQGITRYTRIENGFDNGKDWLKENLDISNKSTLAIDDNIYLIQDGQIIKFNKGKKVSFSQDTSIQKASLLYTTEDTEFMWILDAEHNTLFKTKKETGQKVDKYVHPKFHDATTLVVAEQNNTATILTSEDVLSFKLEK